MHQRTSVFRSQSPICTLADMHRDIDVVVCQPLDSGGKRNQGSDSTALQGSLAFFAGYVGIHAGIFLIVIDVQVYRIPVVADSRFLRSCGRVGVTDDIRLSAVNPKAVGQLTNGIMTYPCEPLAEA